MRQRFGDHSANERTLLAWIRTGIAIMAFGFLVEKFTLFLNYLRIDLHQHNQISGSNGGRVGGLILIAIGIVTIGSATFRFKVISGQIDSPGLVSDHPDRFALAIGSIIALAGTLLFIYLIFQLNG